MSEIDRFPWKCKQLTGIQPSLLFLSPPAPTAAINKHFF